MGDTTVTMKLEDVIGATLSGLSEFNSQTVSFGTQVNELVAAQLDAQGPG